MDIPKIFHSNPSGSRCIFKHEVTPQNETSSLSPLSQHIVQENSLFSQRLSQLQDEDKILALEQELAVLRNLARAPHPPESKVQTKLQTRQNPKHAASKAEVLKIPPRPSKIPTPVSAPVKSKKKTAKIPWVHMSKHLSSQEMPLQELTGAQLNWLRSCPKTLPICPSTQHLKKPSANAEENYSHAESYFTEEKIEHMKQIIKFLASSHQNLKRTCSLNHTFLS